MPQLWVSKPGGHYQRPHTPQINRGSVLAAGLVFHATLGEQGENAAHDAVAGIHQSSGIIHPGIGPAGYSRYRTDSTSPLLFAHYSRYQFGTGPFTAAIYGRLDDASTAYNALSNNRFSGNANQWRILTNFASLTTTSGAITWWTTDGTASYIEATSILDANANHWYVCVRRADGTMQIWRDGTLFTEAARTARDVSGSLTDPINIGWNIQNSTGRSITRASVWNRALSSAEIQRLAVSPDELTARRRISVLVTTQPSVVPAEASHAHSADSLTLTTSTALAIADAAHAHAADSIALSTLTQLTLEDALHGHAADAPTLSTQSALAVDDATHAHSAEAVVLGVTGAASLTVADATHAHSVDGIVLSAQSVLAIQDALHAHAADGITLDASGAAVLLLADALHAHAADGVALTVDAWLVVADAVHTHAADSVVLVASGSGTGATAAEIWSYTLSNGLTAEATLVAVHTMLSELHLIHGLTAGSPLSVTAASRAAGAVSQAVAEAAGTVTVTRQ